MTTKATGPRECGIRAEAYVPLPCGTHAAYSRHRRAGEEPCAECRKAHSAYQVEYRARRKARGANYDAARTRALTRLAALHPAQYRILLDEEMRS